jgi:molybdenum cofactor guanylyltransferase
MDRFAGILLAGGRSSRMGVSKAHLEWNGMPLVEHMARMLVRTLDGPVVVVHARGQALPPLPAGVELAEDARANRGPLEGLAAGLRAVGDRAGAAFVSATDAPFLRAEVVRLVAGALDEASDAVVPRLARRVYPLTAAYRTAVLATVERHLAGSRLRAVALLSALEVRWLGEDELRAVDPELVSLVNLNTREDYEAALAARRAGDSPSRSGCV